LALDDALSSPGFVQDKYSVYRRLRDEDPVHWCDPWDAWLVSRYDAVSAVLRDTVRFRNRVYAGWFEQVPADLRQELRPFIDYWKQYGFEQNDPPDHTRLRSLVMKAINRGVVEAMESRILAHVDGLIDAVAPSGHMELNRDFATPLPLVVISELLGLPESDRDRFKHWADEYLLFIGVGVADPDVLRRSQAGFLALQEWIREAADARRRQPQADLLTALVEAQEQGHGLSDGELLSVCVDLASGGEETVSKMLGNAILALLGDPDAIVRLQRDPELLPSAVEELLRYDCPFHQAWRVAAEDTELDGKVIREGQVLRVLLGSANRDPSQFDDPDSLDLDRDPNRHVALGFGAHFCVGNMLARTELRIAIGRLLERLPGLRLATDTIEWLPSVGPHGVKELPLKFDAKP
jgi:cytochrome P450